MCLGSGECKKEKNKKEKKKMFKLTIDLEEIQMVTKVTHMIAKD